MSDFLEAISLEEILSPSGELNRVYPGRVGKISLWKFSHMIASRGDTNLHMGVQYIHISMRGCKGLHEEVHHIHIAMRGSKDNPMEVQHIIASRGNKDPFLKV